MPSRARRLVLTLLVCAGLATTLYGQLQILELSDPDLKEWLTEAEAHKPGTLDVHATTIAHWPYRRLTRVAEKINEKIPAAWILKGAELYLDIATYMPLDSRPAYPTEGRSLNSVDGRPIGTGNLDSHIWWARRLVNRLLLRDKLDRADRARSLAWYNDVSAMFAGRIWLADLQWHLEAAALRFPDDQVVLFDRGCLDEALASPVIQQAAAAHKDSAAMPTGASERFPIVSPREHYDRAERLFTQSLSAAPSGEAHVRLGRLLLERGRVDDAMRPLQSATTDADEAIVFYAGLFLARAHAAKQSWDAAERALDAAVKLYPEAQSAHLARSALRLQRGNPAAARASLGAVVDPRVSRDDRRDPWWRYHWCRGRDDHRAAVQIIPVH